MPVYKPPFTSNPGVVHSIIANNSGAQNAKNAALAGGGKKYRKRQTGGVGVPVACGSSFINSTDGWDYVPPVGCMAVPVLSDASATGLAGQNTYTAAVGAANAENDHRFNE
jgi:hypothetical protein